MIISVGSNAGGGVLSYKSLRLDLPLGQDIFQFHTVQQVLDDGLALCQARCASMGTWKKEISLLPSEPASL